MDRRFMFDMIPFEFKEKEVSLKRDIQDQHLGMIFDGTTRHGEAMAVVVSFVSKLWRIEQRVIL